MKLQLKKAGACGAGLMLFVVLAGGCSKAPDAAPATGASETQLTDSRIQSIQNDPKMSPADKQKAIDILKSRQGGSAGSGTGTTTR